MTTEERFWSKVDRGAPEECWRWKASVVRTRASGLAPSDWNRYGQFWDPAAGRPVYAHRFSYELANGCIPEGAVVLHTCDRPRCVNPAHLFVGTQIENIASACEQGHYARKLTEEDVEIIKAELAAGATQIAIAERFGVGRRTIGNIAAGEIWQRVEPRFVD